MVRFVKKHCHVKRLIIPIDKIGIAKINEGRPLMNLFLNLKFNEKITILVISIFVFHRKICSNAYRKTMHV